MPSNYLLNKQVSGRDQTLWLNRQKRKKIETSFLPSGKLVKTTSGSGQDLKQLWDLNPSGIFKLHVTHPDIIHTPALDSSRATWTWSRQLLVPCSRSLSSQQSEQLTMHQVLTAIILRVHCLPPHDSVSCPRSTERRMEAQRNCVIWPDDTARRKQRQGSNPDDPCDPGATLQHSLMWPPAPESVFQPVVPAFAPPLALVSHGLLSAPFHWQKSQP